MKLTFRSILGYLIGIPILLFGVLALVTSVIGGIVLIVAGIIAVPKTRRVFQSKTGIEFSTGAAAGIPTILILIGIVALAMATAGTTGAPGSDVSNVSVEHQGLNTETDQSSPAWCDVQYARPAFGESRSGLDVTLLEQ